MLTEANSFKVTYDSRIKNAGTGKNETVKLITKISAISPQAAAYLSKIQALLDSANIQVDYLSHGDTIHPGKFAAIRTNGTTVTIRVNDAGIYKELQVVDIYVPVNLSHDLVTTTYCLGPNHVRFIGNINGKEAEAIIMAPSVTIDLINDKLAKTVRIVQPESYASTTFTAEIYNSVSTPDIPFTAEIYETELPTFTAEIYED